LEATVSFKPASTRLPTKRDMHPLARVAYVALAAVLTAKLVLLVSLQGRGRTRSKVFRWPEDASAFGGRVADGSEDPCVERAQAALRNDGEGQWLFLVVGGAWVLLGAHPFAALAAFGTYALARCAHSALMLHPAQPARTRVFGVGLLVTIAVATDALRLALAAL
jgi:hypothetical protein